MRKLVLMIVSVWALTAGVARAQDATAIENVIGSQLEAFNARDIDAAWSHASVRSNSETSFSPRPRRGYCSAAQ